MEPQDSNAGTFTDSVSTFVQQDSRTLRAYVDWVFRCSNAPTTEKERAAVAHALRRLSPGIADQANCKDRPA